MSPEEIIASALARKSMEFPICPGSHMQVADKHRMVILDKLARIEIAATFVRQWLCETPDESDADIDRVVEVMAGLHLEVAYLMLKFRDTRNMAGEA